LKHISAKNYPNVGYYLYEEQKKLQLRQHALEIPEDTIQNMGIHGSITGKTMTRIMFRPYNNCYYSSSVLEKKKKGILSENVNRPNVCASEGLRRNVTWADVVRSK